MRPGQRFLFFLLLFCVFWLAVGACYLLYRFQILSTKPKRANCCEVVPASLTQISRRPESQKTKTSSAMETSSATETASDAKASAAAEALSSTEPSSTVESSATPDSSTAESPSTGEPTSTAEAFSKLESSSAPESSLTPESSSTPESSLTPNPSAGASSISALLDPSQGARRVVLDIQPQIQKVWNYCAPTTVSMILQSQGIEISQEVLAQEMGTAEPFGTHNADAIDVLNRHLERKAESGKTKIIYTLATVTSGAKESEDMRLFLDRLLENIDRGYPMYYTFDVSKLYPGRKGEHNVIGIGYALNEAGDVEKLYYWDPDPTVQDPVYKGLKVVSPTKLLDAMTTCVEPNYGW